MTGTGAAPTPAEAAVLARFLAPVEGELTDLFTLVGRRLPPVSARRPTRTPHAGAGQGGQTGVTRVRTDYLAATHRGRPVGEILPLLRAAADRALLGFTPADLREQAEAISTGEP
ncbi:hypothetical protein [Streptomyces sp. BE133]|uniref:hypothetical protein n=1 Tax=Streptomyces sp. BE133 TaxID=3002523 RepID=UPI002E7A379A|nr:hypothetical protein [Streptomyces sp. BE133]MEE1810332.1 hypothetical protein [Streptomyces sp. BE133]